MKKKSFNYLTIACDIGNVLCTMDLDSFVRALSNKSNTHPDHIWSFLKSCQGVHDLGLVKLHDELMFNFKLKEDDANELIEKWNKILKPEKKMIDTLEKLYKNGAKIALFSNIGYEHSGIIKNVIGNLLDSHAIKHFSCDVGARKPSYLYYELFFKMHPSFNDNERIVYIDDLKENLEAAKIVNPLFDTYHFDLSKIDDELLDFEIKKLVNYIIN